LFVNGVGTKEVLDPNGSCTNGNAQYTNRVAALGKNDTTLCSTWAKCLGCTPANIGNLSTKNVSVSIANNFVKINSGTNMLLSGVEIFDILGKKIYSSNGAVSTNQELPVNLQSNVVYIVKIADGANKLAVKASIK
jgi:uncharacterized membrane protein